MALCDTAAVASCTTDHQGLGFLTCGRPGRHYLTAYSDGALQIGGARAIDIGQDAVVRRILTIRMQRYLGFKLILHRAVAHAVSWDRHRLRFSGARDAMRECVAQYFKDIASLPPSRVIDKWLPSEKCRKPARESKCAFWRPGTDG